MDSQHRRTDNDDAPLRHRHPARRAFRTMLLKYWFRDVAGGTPPRHHATASHLRANQIAQ